VAGGLGALLGGDRFGHGFFAAGFTQAFSGRIGKLDKGHYGISPERVIAAAIVGGTASALTGGKFANGAITGAFSRAFNDETEILRNPAAAAEDQLKSVLEKSGLDHMIKTAMASPVELVVGVTSGATFDFYEELLSDQLNYLSEDGIDYSTNSYSYKVGKYIGVSLSTELIGSPLTYGFPAAVSLLPRTNVFRALWMSGELLTDGKTALQAGQLTGDMARLNPAAGYIVPEVRSSINIPYRPQTMHLPYRP